MAYTKANGYNEKDLLHFGYAHIKAAEKLFKDDCVYFDSAGYLAHLGTEVILKACHLYYFGKFDNTHDLNKLYNELSNHESSFNIEPKHIKFLEELNNFYELRYPCCKKPVEVGDDMLEPFIDMHRSLYDVFPSEIKKIYKNIDVTKKGNRVLMEKKI